MVVLVIFFSSAVHVGPRDAGSVSRTPAWWSLTWFMRSTEETTGDYQTNRTHKHTYLKTIQKHFMCFQVEGCKLLWVIWHDSGRGHPLPPGHTETVQDYNEHEWAPGTEQFRKCVEPTIKHAVRGGWCCRKLCRQVRIRKIFLFFHLVKSSLMLPLSLWSATCRFITSEHWSKCFYLNYGGSLVCDGVSVWTFCPLWSSQTLFTFHQTHYIRRNQNIWQRRWRG